MKALTLTDYAGPQALELAEISEPIPSDGEVLIEVRAIGINFPDLLITKGAYQNKPELPFVPGCEVAGDIVTAPKGSQWKAGDRVAAFVWTGGYAERVAVPTSALMRLTDQTDYPEGAALMVNYHTALFALQRRGRLQPGETVLVLGAGGGIGTAAIQIARGLGASVIAGIAHDGQMAAARAAGASRIVVLDENFPQAVRDTNNGASVDVVVDPLGDRFFDEAVRLLSPEGRVLVIGFAAGEIPTIKVNRLLLRNASVVGVAWGAFNDADPHLMASQAKVLASLVETGMLAPAIGSTFKFEEIQSALHQLERGEIQGKAIATL